MPTRDCGTPARGPLWLAHRHRAGGGGGGRTACHDRRHVDDRRCGTLGKLPARQIHQGDGRGAIELPSRGRIGGHAAHIVHKPINTAGPCAEGRHQGRWCGRIGKIGLERTAARASGDHASCGRLRMHEIHAHDRTFFGQQARGRSTDAARSTRHQNSPPVENARHQDRPFAQTAASAELAAPRRVLYVLRHKQLLGMPRGAPQLPRDVARQRHLFGKIGVDVVAVDIVDAERVPRRA